MSASPDMEQQIAALLRRDLGLAVPSYETDLLDTGILDSLGIVELILRIEETFGVKLAVSGLEVNSFRSIATIASLVRQTAAT
jgi:D-alanine--poly(phosphoribitol) ligase subunit 2